MPFKDKAKRAEADRRRRQAQRLTKLEAPGGPPDPAAIAPPVAPLPLTSAAEALVIIAAEVNAVRADAGTNAQARGRTVAYLIAVALRAIEVSDYGKRLDALEAAEEARKGTTGGRRP